ncbi:YihY/virulence factor BrkB family protein [Naasia sp. SYSU D00948]|uniref:YihY/virulence factor BrkB family protein n=1 Tax=Naasia sp. SYSU D00948 TaxID=2817379 RepID=UPI001B318759|nr:YihY/virulence factor BrkB family protein [Naasia sp. SYSU D00948]
MASDAETLAVRDGETVATAPSAKPTPDKPKTGIAAVIDKVVKSRPVRTVIHYNEAGGPLLAAGMTYNAVFATFASLWLSFSVAGFIVAGSPELQTALFNAINGVVPGLVAEDGVIDPEDLLGSVGALSWTSAVAVVALLFTALGFLASMRDAIRRIFDLPADTTNPVLQKLRDFGLALCFGVLIIVSAGLQIFTNAALDAVFNVLGIDNRSLFAVVVATVLGNALVFLVDFVTVAAAFRILSAVKIPLRRLLVGAAIGAVAIDILKAAFGLGLIGGAGNNPLLAGFAVFIGLLIFFNFFCQVLLIAASWIQVGMEEAGIEARSLSPQQAEAEEALRLEEARRLVADANHRKAEEEYRSARGLRKLLLARRIRRDVRTEARRRASVPTTEELFGKEIAERATTKRP